MPNASLRPPARVSLACFLFAGAWLCVGCVLLNRAAEDVVFFFHQSRPLAVVHCFTLGWVTSMMMGVLYQYVPALTKQPLPWPRLPGWQVGLFEIGILGLVTHFWIGHFNGMAWSAAMIAAAVLLFVMELVLPIIHATKDATVLGIGVALICLAGTATLGLLYAIDMVHTFLPGHTLSNIAGHAHLGLLGWMALTICAVSYRMLAAFVLSETVIPTTARRQILALSVLVPALVIALLQRSMAVPWLAGLTAMAFAWYGVNLWLLLRTRRLPIDWSIGHIVAGLVHLLVAGVCGFLLMVIEVDSELGTRVVVIYGVLLLLGWVSNTMVGIGTRMLPGLMGSGAQPLLPASVRGLTFVLLNGGVLAIAVAVALGSAAALQLAALLPLATGLIFAGCVARRARGRSVSQPAG